MVTCTLRSTGTGTYAPLADVHAVLDADGRVALHSASQGEFRTCCVAARGADDAWVAIYARGGAHADDDACVHLAELAFPLDLGLFPRGSDLLFFSFTAPSAHSMFLGFPPPAALPAGVLQYAELRPDGLAAFQSVLRTQHAVQPLAAWLHQHVDVLWQLAAPGRAQDAAEIAAAPDAPYYSKLSHALQHAEEDDNDDAFDPDCWSAIEVVQADRAAAAKSIRTAKSCRSVCTASEYDCDSSVEADDSDAASDASDELMSSDDSGDVSDPGTDEGPDGSDAADDTDEDIEDEINQDGVAADEEDKEDDLADVEDD